MLDSTARDRIATTASADARPDDLSAAPASAADHRSVAVHASARGEAARTLALCTVALLIAAMGLGVAGVGPLSLVVAALGWLTLCAFVLSGLPRHPHARFGAANAITTLRAAITVTLLALVPEAGLPGGVMAGAAAWWAVTAAAVLSLCLDGVDGALARRAGLESAFGARFDMEIDALLALVLALLIWRGGELGPWVLALGTMRYAFLAAAHPLPALRAPLYPSMRRKSVCVLQIAALCAIVSPLIAPPLSLWIGLVATLALVFSFGRDTRWLLRRSASARPDPREPAGPPRA